MKTNKRILLILTLVSVTMLMALQANAVSDFKIGNMEYSSADISKEKLEQIFKAMYGIYDVTKTPRNILCIFGHSTTTGTITTIEHNYYSTAPKCKETNTRVEYCNRSSCDYFLTKEQYISRVGCH